MAPSSKTILLVEDEAIIAIAAAKTIQRFGYAVIIANSGEKSVELAAENKNVALVLMDIDLGKGINGPEAAAQILTNRTLPIVFLTSHSEREMVEKVRGITRYGYVIKNSGDFVLQSSIEMAFELFEAHQKMTESEEKYSAAFKTSPDSVNINFMDGRYVDINDGFTKLSGYKREEVLGKLSTELKIWAIPEDREKLVKGLREKGSVDDLESSFRCKDGSLKKCLMSARVIRFNGQPHILSITRDITEWKLAEKQKNESEANHRLLFETMTQGVMYFSAKGEIISANPAAERILGLSDDFMTGKNVMNPAWKMIREDGSELPMDEHPLIIALRTGKPVKEFIMGMHNPQKKDFIWISLTQIPIMLPGEIRPYQIFSTFEDITERKKAEEALRKINRHFKSVLEASQDVIAMMDTEYRYILFNSAFHEEFRKIFGKDLTAGDSMPEALAHLPNDLEDAVKHWKRALGGDDFIIIQQFGDTALERNWYELHFSPIRDNDGTVVSAVHFVRNIAERKQAEEALSQERNLLRTLIDNLPDSVRVYIKNSESRYVINNLAHLRSIGISRQKDAVGKTSADFFPSEQAKGFLEDEQNVIRTGQALLGKEEIVFNRELGEERWHLTSKVPLCDGAGKVVGLAGMCSDITELKRNEKALRENAELFQLISDLTTDYIFISKISEDGRIELDKALGSLEKITGYTVEENKAIGHWRKTVHPDDLEKDAHDYQKLLNHERVVSEIRTFHKNGNIVWMKTYARPTWDERTNKVTSIAGAVQDITERKHAEMALRESEERLAIAMEQAHLAHWELDAATQMFTFNDQFYKLYATNAEREGGYRMPVEVYAREFMIPEEQHFISAGLVQLLSGEAGHLLREHRIRRRDGELRNILVRITVIRDSAGSVVGTSGTNQDITEQKKKEEEITKLLQEKELIMHEVHHRIKNNMNTVMSLLSLQADSIKSAEAVASLNDAANRLRSMGVLYDKLYRSSDLKAVSVKEYVSTLTDEVIKNFPNSGIVTVEKEIEDFTIDTKKISPLGIIVNEILTNIMKHAFAGRDSGKIEIRSSIKEKHATVIVQDNGIGIPDSAAIGNADTFGLQLVDMLTQQIGGTMRIERGNGTKFVLEFEVL